MLMTSQPGLFPVQLVLPDSEKTIQASSEQHIWDAALARGIVLPAMCHQGRCLTCAGKLDGPGDFDPSDAVCYFPDDKAEGFILLCTAKPDSPLRIRTHQAEEMRKFRLSKNLPAPYS
jgi:ferredoxin